MKNDSSRATTHSFSEKRPGISPAENHPLSPRRTTVEVFTMPPRTWSWSAANVYGPSSDPIRCTVKVSLGPRPGYAVMPSPRLEGRCYAHRRLPGHAAVGAPASVYGGRVTRKNSDDDQRLPSRPSAGEVIGGMLAGLEHQVTGRPNPPAQIEEQYGEPWASAGGI